MVISRLNLKLIRDIRYSPWLFLGIVVVVALGIALFDATYISYNSLGRSYDLTYERLNLADFSIDMHSAPRQAVDRVRRIPGVQLVQGRSIESTPVEILDGDVRVIGMIHSIPDQGLPDVNSIILTEGTLPGPGTTRELLVEHSFATHHGLSPGDLIHPIVDENRVRFRISGIFMSPEYIYAVPDAESLGPQPEQFGIFFMRRTMMDSLLGTSGTIDQIVATVTPDANRDRIMNQAAELLATYGAEDPVPREEFPSVELLALDLEQFRVLAVFFPTLFLAIASLSIYNLLSRMVLSQRSQIGLMRAMGYPRAAVLKHYMAFAVLIGLLGSLIGTYFGYLMAGWITNLYAEILAVPFTIIALRYDIMALGILISVLISVLAGWIPAQSAARLTPADAIRAEHATIGGVPVLENYIPWLRNASYTWRLPFRELLRAPKRTLSTIAGIAASVALIISVAGLMNTITAMINFYFEEMLRYDAVVAYFGPRSEAQISQIRTITGVLDVEPSMQLGLTMHYGDNRSVDIQVIGVEPNTRLMTVIGADRRPVAVPPTGIAVGGDFMRIRGLAAGQPVILSYSERLDLATLEGLQGPTDLGFRRRLLRPTRGIDRAEIERQVWITREVYQPIGNLVVMNIHEMRRLFTGGMNAPPNAVTAAIVQLDPEYSGRTLDRLRDLPGVATVVDIAGVRNEIDTAMEFANTFIAVMFAFAVSLAFVVLFNATTINILERTRETASIRALGTSRAQVAAMLTIENLTSWFLGTIIGIPLGIWLGATFMALWTTETFHPRLAIFTSTYVLTVVGILVTVLVSQLPGIRYLNRLNLASATKEITG